MEKKEKLEILNLQISHLRIARVLGAYQANGTMEATLGVKGGVTETPVQKSEKDRSVKNTPGYTHKGGNAKMELSIFNNKIKLTKTIFEN